MEDTEKHRFISRVNSLMPLAFLTTLMIFLGAAMRQPELLENEAIIAVMGGLAGSAATVANSQRDVN